MALQGWDKNYREQLKIQEQEIEALQQQLMISGKGGSPGQPYDDPEEGKGPFVPAPPRDKLARANNIRGFQDSGYQLNIPLHDWKQIPPAIKNDPDFIRLHLRRMQAHGKHFDEYGQPIQDPTRGMDPSGNPITIPHLQQTPEEAEQNKQLHMDKYHPKNDLQIAGLNLGGGRHLTNDEINFLRSIFPTVSEKEKHRLIEMYSDKPFRGLG